MSLSQSVSLRQYIDKTSIECLNQDDRFPISNAIESPNPSLYLQSAIDCQLLVKFSFHQAVRIERLIIGGAKDDKGNVDIDNTPNKIKIFINNINLGFEEAESQIPLYQSELSMDEYKHKGHVSIPLNVSKFRSVQTISFFFEDNFGTTDISKIGYIDLEGRLVESTNIGDWKPVDKAQQWAVNDS